MESLAYIQSAIAYEDPNPSPTLVLWQGFNGQKRPSAGWLKFLWIGVMVATTISLTEVAQAATVKVKTNSGNGLNVRVQPTAGAAQMGGLTEGTVVDVADSSTPGWRIITSGAYKNGYIDGQWTVPTSTGGGDPIVGGTMGKMQVKTDTGLGMNVRSAPTVSSSIIGGLSEREIIGVTASDTPDWSKITEGRFIGSYVSNSWLMSLGTSSDPIIPVVNSNTEKKYAIKTNTGNGLNVRALPTKGSAVMGGLGEGEKISAKPSGTPGWLVITSGSYPGGYVATDWAMPVDGLIPVYNPNVNNSQGNYRVRTNSGIGVVVRSSPSSASPNLGGLGEGSVVNAAPAGNGWMQIISGPYAGGYISGAWVAPSSGNVALF